MFKDDMIQHRHVIVLDVPGKDGCPGRGDIEVLLTQSDATMEALLTLERPMVFPDEAEDADLSKMVPDPNGKWTRRDYCYGAEDPKQAFDDNTNMIEALEETLRFLKAERPGLLAKATAWLVDPKNPEFWRNDALWKAKQGEKTDQSIRPKIDDFS